MPSGFLTIPLYGLTTAGLITLDRNKAKTPKQIYQLGKVAVLSAFFWGSAALSHPAQALVFNRLGDGLTKAVTAFGVTGLDKVPNWIVSAFLMFTFVIVAGLIIGWMKARHGDDEENTRAVNSAVSLIVKLLVGDVILSLIGI